MIPSTVNLKVATTVQAVFFLLHKSSSLTKLSILKLMYLADKHHLLHYGRTITNNNDYFAIRLGPIASLLANILNKNKEQLSPSDIRYSTSFIDYFEESGKPILYASKKIHSDLELLSSSDKESLLFVISKFSKLSASQLVDYVHKYPEWLQYKSILKTGTEKRKKLHLAELFSVIDQRLGITPHQAVLAKQTFMEC